MAVEHRGSCSALMHFFSVFLGCSCDSPRMNVVTRGGPDNKPNPDVVKTAHVILTKSGQALCEFVVGSSLALFADCSDALFVCCSGLFDRIESRDANLMHHFARVLDDLLQYGAKAV